MRVPSFARDVNSDFSQHSGGDVPNRSARQNAQKNLWKIWYCLNYREINLLNRSVKLQIFSGQLVTSQAEEIPPNRFQSDNRPRRIISRDKKPGLFHYRLFHRLRPRDRSADSWRRS
jgi:hypothetical protein